MNDLRPALFIIGNLLVFFSIYMLVPAIVDFYYGGNDWVVFVTISSLCFFIGLNTSFVFKNDKKDIGILARSGFDFETSKKVLNLEKDEYLKIINLL